MAKQEKKFSSGMEKATAGEVDGNTPVMIAVNGITKQFSLGEFKNHLELTGTELIPIASGLLPTPLAGQIRTMDVVGPGTWTHPTLTGGASLLAGQTGKFFFSGGVWSLRNVQNVKGDAGGTLSQLFNPAKVGGYAIDEVVRDAEYVEYVSLVNSNSSVLSDISKWRLVGVKTINKISEYSRDAISSGSVYARLNGGASDLFNISDLTKFTGSYSNAAYTIVLDFVAPNDGYIDFIKLRGTTAGTLSFIFLEAIGNSFNIRKELRHEITVGENIVNLNAKLLKGERLAFRWDTTTNLARIGYSPTDSLANFYAISGAPAIISLPAKSTIGAFGIDFKFNENGGLFALNSKIKTEGFIPQSGALTPDYAANAGYFTLALTPAAGQSVVLLDSLPLGETKVVKFRAKADALVTNLFVGVVASNSNIPFTHRINITVEEQTFEMDIQGVQAGSISLGILAANNTGQIIQIRDFQIIDKYSLQGVFNKTLTSKSKYTTFSSGRVDMGGKVVASGMRHLKLNLTVGDSVEYSLATASSESVIPIFLIGLLRENDSILEPILWEKDSNIGGMASGRLQITKKGTYIFQTYSNLIPAYTTPYIEVTKASEILTDNDIDNRVVSMASVVKSSIHYFNIGGNYTIDAHFKYPADDPHNRFDHLTFVTLNGDLIGICQRFRTVGADFNYSEIAIYRSGNGGANWSLITTKPVTSLADANPLALENNDGTITILFVKQVSGSNTPRDLYSILLNRDYSFSDEKLVYDAVKNCALGGTPPMKINNDSYITFYEEDANARMVTKIFKHNHVSKITTDTNTTVSSASYSMEEPGLYELPNGDWVLYFRTYSSWSRATISKDKGVSWGPEFKLLRATWTMSAVYKLACLTSSLESIYVAVVNEWNTDESNWYQSTPLQRRYLSMLVSKDGLHFEKLGYIYKYNGKYSAFEPTIYEYGGNTLVGWSTMPPDMGGGLNASQGGCAFVNITPIDRVLNYVNGRV